MSPHRLLALLSMPSAFVTVSGRKYILRTHPDRRRKPVLELDEAEFLRLSEGLRFVRSPEGEMRLWSETQVPVMRRAAPLTPLEGLRQQMTADGAPFLQKRHVLAGQQWCADHHSAFAPAHLTTNWSAFGSGGSSGSRALNADPHLWRMRAQERYQSALAALRDLAQLMVKVCLEDVAISTAERALHLPRRTGRERVREGLERLARHYRL